VNKEVDPGLIATPQTGCDSVVRGEHEQDAGARAAAGWQMRELTGFTMVFDREGYSPDLFGRWEEADLPF